ncbi:sulfotransferase [Nonomuraea sp. NPDC049714]|uniref:sulfotransferase n=1 Tax=Nonomuraea sp. NPDC049714 TaxID=3364357 RepID=UPI0037A9FA15
MDSPVKFVLLGHPRSGSTLVTVALQEHPDIRMFGELFHAEFQNRLIAYQWGISRRPSTYMSSERTQDWVYTDHQRGDRFLEDLVFGDPSEDRPAAIGFKFFYDHARAPRAISAWDYLRDDPEVRIVHLVRENLLDCLISTMTAEHTRVWEIEAETYEKTPEPPPFVIPPADCAAYFEKMTALRRRATTELAAPGRAVLEIEYERDVHSDFDGTLRRVQEFLGVPARPLPQRLRKLSRRPAHVLIANYAELSRHFAPTPARAFFDGTGAGHARRHS